MGVEVRVEGLTKSFGAQPVWADVSLTLPAGEISVLLGPSGTGKSVFLKTLVGLLKPDRGSIWIDGEDLAGCPSGELYEIRKLFGVLFQDGALFGSMNIYDNVAFPLREHTRKSESRDPARSSRRSSRWSACTGAEDEAARRDLRRHAQAGRPGPGAGPRPGDHPLRRARLRPRPGPHRLPQPAHHRPQPADRRDVPDRHPRHQHRPHRARQHRPALPRPPGHVRPPGDAAVQHRAGGPAVPQRPADRPDRHGRGEGRRPSWRPRPPPGAELPPLPPIPPQLRPSDGRPAPAERPPGQWCRDTASPPPTGSFGAPTAALVLAATEAAHDRPGGRWRCASPATSSRSASTRCAALSAPAVPAARVHPAVLVHQLGVDPAGRAGVDPVRRGHRAAARLAGPPARRAVVHRRRPRCWPSSARPARSSPR